MWQHNVCEAGRDSYGSGRTGCRLKQAGEIDDGDIVEYFSLKGDAKPRHVGKVLHILSGGIPSCNRPMIKIEGFSGYVLKSHCRIKADAAEKE